MKQQASVAAARVNSWLMPLLAMSLPLSTAAVTVLALLIAAAWAIEGDYARKFKEMIGNKVSLALIIFLLLYIL
ncbi:MAG: hypothetical protein PHX57_12830, partial [Desulfobulbaceae bacterium]|nr:hypothetical protein [Desulfobulbaceae bacterium]